MGLVLGTETGTFDLCAGGWSGLTAGWPRAKASDEDRAVLVLLVGRDEMVGGPAEQRHPPERALSTGVNQCGHHLCPVVRQFELVTQPDRWRTIAQPEGGLSGSSIRLFNSQCRSHMRIGKALPS